MIFRDLCHEHQEHNCQRCQWANEDVIWKRCLTPHSALRPLDVCDKPLKNWGDTSWRCPDGHYNPHDTLRREALGRLVREVWVVWAKDIQSGLYEKKDLKPHHLFPWEKLSNDDREVDRRIGETLAGIRDWRIGQTSNSRALNK